MHIYRESRKNGIFETICREGTEMQIQTIDFWTQGSREWEKWEGIIDTHTLPWVKQIDGKKLLYNTGSPARHSVMMWMGDGRKAQERGDTCIIMVDLHYYMAETNITL